MKTLFTLAILLICSRAFSQDTLQHYEWLEGQKVLIREITSDSIITHDVPRIVTMVLVAISVLVFIFHKPKHKDDAKG